MNRFNMAYTEILEILKHLPDEDYKKIPKDEIDFFKQNKDKKYHVKFNEDVAFEEQAILPETEAIIVELYKNYFCTNEQKLTLNKILHINNEISKNDSSYKNFNDIFPIKPQQKEVLSTTSTQENTLQIPKRKWYEIIFHIINRKKN